MTLAELRPWVEEKISSYPNLKEEIIDYYELCIDEIESGESVTNEIALCVSSINDLIEDYND